MGKRGLKAVIYLTNFWEWSGGMMTYLYWTNGGRYINMNDPAHPWPEFPDFVSRFLPLPAGGRDVPRLYSRGGDRTNSITGRRYVDDPAIMAWQLANEPRPARKRSGRQPNLPAFYAWVRATARLIKSLDPNHLVSTGSEGPKGCPRARLVVAEHASPEIDYLTTHVWPQNWGWVDPADIPGTWPRCETLVREYVGQHLDRARGSASRWSSRNSASRAKAAASIPRGRRPTRTVLFRLIYSMVLEQCPRGGPAAGSQFLGVERRGPRRTPRPPFPARRHRLLGDPPHEPQGWYGVFDSDASTQAVIREHAPA